MALQGLFDLVASRGDDLRGMRPPRFGGNPAGIDPRHFQQILEQPRQALDLGQYQIALLQTFVARQVGRFHVARRYPDRRERRPEVVTERGEQRRLELFALPRQLASLPLFEKFSTFNGDRDHAGECVERAWLHGPAGGGEDADRLRPDPQGHQSNDVPVDVWSCGGPAYVRA